MVYQMTQKRFVGAVFVLAMSASPLALASPSSALSGNPGQILDLPSCDGQEIDPYEKRVKGWKDRGMMGDGIFPHGWGASPEESRFTETLGNVVVRIDTSRAPKGTTRFQLRYWTGTWGVDEAGPFHAKFFKKTPIRVRIPNAQYDTPYRFQVAALKGDCIAYATGAAQYGSGVWCSVKEKWEKIEGPDGRPSRMLRCPKIKD